MIDATDEWVARQRQRWMRPNAQLYLREDHERFLPPAEAQKLRDERKFEADIDASRRLLAVLRREVSDIRRILHERKYRPDQPRVPAGNPDGGQWTFDPSANHGSNGIAPPRAGPRRIQLYRAGPPRIPSRRPPTARERNIIIKEVAAWLWEHRVAAAEFIKEHSWLSEAYPYINAYLDDPKSLSELQKAVNDPQRGYDIHHIVEQTAAEEAGYSRRLIDGKDNLVRIPTLRHWQINGWFQRKNEDFGNVSPRNYLIGKDWDERRRVGLSALVKYGVLKP